MKSISVGFNLETCWSIGFSKALCDVFDAITDCKIKNSIINLSTNSWETLSCFNRNNLFCDDSRRRLFQLYIIVILWKFPSWEGFQLFTLRQENSSAHDPFKPARTIDIRNFLDSIFDIFRLSRLYTSGSYFYGLFVYIFKFNRCS